MKIKYYIYSIVLLCLLIATGMVAYDVIDVVIHPKHEVGRTPWT